MARAANYKHSPVIGDNGITATPAELNKLTQQALDTFLLSVNNTVDLHNVDSVKNAIIDYFQTCQKNGLRPGNLGLYAALGMSRQDYNDVIRGKNKSKASLETIDIMKKAVRAVGAYREGLVQEGKLNPVTYIFMAKNYDGLEDQTRIDITATRGQDPNLTPEQVARQIEKDIPIDV